MLYRDDKNTGQAYGKVACSLPLIARAAEAQLAEIERDIIYTFHHYTLHDLIFLHCIRGRTWG